MRITGVIVLCILAASMIGGISFWFGKSYGIDLANSGEDGAVILKENMVLLTTSGEVGGMIPAGVKLYRSSDRFGDKTSRFKLFLQTDTNDETPLTADYSQRKHPYEAEIYFLKSQHWLKGVQRRK